MNRYRDKNGRTGALWSRAATSVLLSAGTLVVVVLLAVGCSQMTQYRVLSFFFDGVPPPPGVAPAKPETVTGPWGIELPAEDQRAQAFLRATTRRAQERKKQERWVFHEPYRKHRCSGCHVQEASYQIKVLADTCRKCHSSHYELQADDWAHGPVALGQCALCHVPHRSKHTGLLTKKMPEVCFDCHDPAQTQEGPHHSMAGDRKCTDCHDPHLAGNRMLLVDSGSYARRTRRSRPLPSKHAAWDKKTCTNCHLPERSNQLVEQVDVQCVLCHEKVREQGVAEPLHKPVQEGKCVDCHVAHRSSRPHLIRPTAEKTCLACHKLHEIEKDSHPAMRRADCLLCHKGHRSPQEHLLNPLGEVSRILQAGDRTGTGRRRP